MDYKAITQASYNVTAIEFAQNVADLAPTQSIQRIMANTPAQPSILDIGCGSGRDAHIFTQLGAKVTGIDFSEQLLNIAQLNNPTATFLLMDIEKLNFAPESFDAAWAACSLMHIPKQKLPAVLKQIYNLLKPRGQFYMSIKQGSGEALQTDTRYEGNMQKYCAYYEEPELKKLLLDTGFTIQNIDLIKRANPYLSHDAFRIFCQK